MLFRSVSGHHNKETHQSVIEGLLRLRLFCNNGLTKESDSSSSLPNNPDEVLSLLQLGGEAGCKYCSCDILSMSALETGNFVHLTECRQLVCGECMTQYQEDLRNAQQNGKHLCPFCHGQHSMENLLSREMGESFATFPSNEDYPSKLVALLKDIQMNSMQEKRYASLNFLLRIRLTTCVVSFSLFGRRAWTSSEVSLVPIKSSTAVSIGPYHQGNERQFFLNFKETKKSKSFL